MSSQPIYLKTGDTLIIQTSDLVYPSCPSINETNISKEVNNRSELYCYVFGILTGLSIVFLFDKQK